MIDDINELDNSNNLQNNSIIETILTEIQSLESNDLSEEQFCKTLKTIESCQTDLSNSQKSQIIQLLSNNLKPLTGEYIWFENLENSVSERWKEQINQSNRATKIFQTIFILTNGTIDANDSNDSNASNVSDDFLTTELTQSLSKSCIYYLYEDFPWVKDHEQTIIAKKLLNKFCSNTENLAESFFSDEFKSAFISPSGNNQISSSGRLKLGNPKRSIDESTSTAVFRSKQQYLLSILRFCIDYLNINQLEINWPFFAPTILNLLDDHEIGFKGIGCQLLNQLSLRLSFDDNNMFKRSGLLPVFIDACKRCLFYLPPGVSADESAFILARVIPALIQLANQCSTTIERNILLDETLRLGVFKAASRADDNIILGKVIMTNSIEISEALEINTVRHLKQFIILFVALLTNPFISSDLSYLELICNSFIKIIHICSLRIDNYRYDIMHGLIKAWKTLDFEEVQSSSARRSLQLVFVELRNSLKSNILELERDVEILVEKDESLRGLLKGEAS